MKLFSGETVLCPEIMNWDVGLYGYIEHIMLIYNEKDDDGKYIDEIIKGPFIVHHVDIENCSVTFARVDPDDEYVPDGYAVTITKDIINHVRTVFISANNVNIHLFPHTSTVNPEIFKMWENRNDSEMYIKYHDKKSDKNMLVHVVDMFTSRVIIDYVSDFEYHRDWLPKCNENFDMDAEVIMW
jgi:hypothetical protein